MQPQSPCPWSIRARCATSPKGTGRRAKTDRIDARMLAMFGLHVQPAFTPPPSPEQTELAAWVTRREQLQLMLQGEIARQIPGLPKSISKDLKASIARLQTSPIGKDQGAPGSTPCRIPSTRSQVRTAVRHSGSRTGNRCHPAWTSAGARHLKWANDRSPCGFGSLMMIADLSVATAM